MPVITVDSKDLETLSGIDRQKIIDNVSMIGAEVERVEEETIDIEFFPNRPDLYSVEGVSRAMKAFFGMSPGLKKYTINPPQIEITIKKEVKDVRPVLGCAVVRGLSFTSASIKSLMDLQEDLHWALGRGRKKVSIGVHDMTGITAPFTYTTESPDYAFVPLDHTEKMTMTEILEKHAKGVKFAHLVKDMTKYPIIKDANGNVLSFPPIINGTLTTVTESTKELFIDVTGTSKEVYTALNIVVAALAERGGIIEAVKIIDESANKKESETILPNLEPLVQIIAQEEIETHLGFKLSADEVIQSLAKMGFDATLISKNPAAFEVLIPAYRADILHKYDVIEDVAIGYGYANIPAKLPENYTAGKSNPLSVSRLAASEAMISLGYSQVMPFTLTSEKIHFENMRRPVTNDVTYVIHPISEDQTMIRTTILPGLLEILALNRHRELPQKIFEVGEVAVNAKNKQKIAAVSIHHAANFTEMSEVVDAFLRETKTEYEIKESDDPAFLPGRVADIYVGGKKVGVFGELHPGVLTAFELGYAVIGFEADMSLIF
ncbi:phenylalanine--tRNA ligase subunit beta [Methanimicrococcus blatticola]|uniref:Phenylalanine--tRNA ligase beta subunit n=1 Tax=Methanimicrococcus blatticola TaxID=91560 RepID=A0A484F6P7_9EURY|nr:phenylalanine--tRNA ligase subunit beta [Methanimicrococcus blatticola]MBZ3935548.1 phenylalanine--tRNA ligase subunit beta [Methanimicrococcus blatticola]MCC2509191.1 phenylalanine--tRNA ligase subunit beta [Methanimicrococcus blatticola]TDQ69443.1 phenylalanyl-tRNA synthetase beta subunit [Methanimicrococcus blatticola]